MIIYTIVVAVDSQEEAHEWANLKLDPEVMTIRGISQSAFLPHFIVRVETSLDPNDYVTLAFEGSLNSQMRDGDVAWWNRVMEAHNKVEPAHNRPRQPRGR